MKYQNTTIVKNLICSISDKFTKILNNNNNKVRVTFKTKNNLMKRIITVLKILQHVTYV